MRQNQWWNASGAAAFIFMLSGLTFIIQNPVFAQVQDEAEVHPQARMIPFDPNLADYQELFDGPNDSVVFYSGVVTLAPGQYGELHSTEIYEEMIIPLEGQGRLIIPDREALLLKYGTIGFVPPETEHQMLNDGIRDFKYIYVAVRSY